MRLFIAIEVPEEITRILKSLQEKIRIPGRATKTKSFHLTLKFLGEVDDDLLPRVKDSLSQIEFGGFDANLSDIGTFPNLNNPRVLWVGLEPHDLINALQKDIDTATQKLGFEMDNRFHPHLTLARIKLLDNKADFKTALVDIKPPQASFPVSEFKLIKSNLTPQGPEYEVLETFSAKNSP
ncbi:RNA 2',3'-cyclic phosphodiesterase [Candidatus Woesearchaeota archaeon]|nr:RNA 2',3'-cyclic phosphodiesterase [Candidatus Woesearchaeota archaeon]